MQEKSEKFDKNLKILIEEFNVINPNLNDLLKISFNLHYNYAINFWIISYAFNEGPIVSYYLGLIEELLKKVYDNETEAINAKENFIRTDYATFYHKILVDSVELRELLNTLPSIQRDLRKAKELNPESRPETYNKIIFMIKEANTKESERILHKWNKHLKKNNLFPVYNLLNQSIDNYEINKLLDKELKEVDLKVNETLVLAKRKLQENDFKKLSDLYLLIKEMLEAKDETFGRKDLELFDFWNKLTDQITSLAEDEAKIKMTFDKERSNLLIPWILEDKLPEHYRSTLRSTKN